ncbi:hypothetical protein TCAL_12540 [Tigriopus californicus]|uniref:Uncharacterized protein n=1 Tax=Tigriopus californicus TaxID=6832 RepID=A0A553PS74_TIGCA|nr:hypothetical protein TCAL_12540 [Tigriopus californicus]|eukprot:TCALIF_12540-PA protein Name:"Protein of unknown function" AED:0.00 eAED:0.00 QI:37/1/1/1/1/1/2/249/74
MQKYLLIALIVVALATLAMSFDLNDEQMESLMRFAEENNFEDRTLEDGSGSGMEWIDNIDEGSIEIITNDPILN